MGQEVILDMDFMVPAGIRLDLAEGLYDYSMKSALVYRGVRRSNDRRFNKFNLKDQHVVISVGNQQK